ncbi:MAG: PorP/SprF family type IX secretion system membrane protein [Bacteroidota bacterium]
MKKLLVFCILAILVGRVSAQDIHFSMFNAAPLTLNPALAGAFNADHRIIGNYKSQWRSIANPYTTYALSYDAGLLKRAINGGFLGVGLQLYNDRAADTKMGVFQANVSLAYHLLLNRNNILTAGVQGGFAQRSISASAMQWGNQYDPHSDNGFNSSLSSGETMNFTHFNYGDFAAGVLYTYNSGSTTMSSNNAFKLNLGISMFHLNKPKQQFMDNEAQKLYRRVNIHGYSLIGIRNTSLSLVPSLAVYFQGPSREIMMGSLFRFRLQDASHYTNFIQETALSVGAHYRFSDAIVAEAMFEYKNFMLGVSYDVNVSKLSVASSGMGGLEVALRYITPLRQSDNKSMY